jgi:hypothetical protein
MVVANYGQYLLLRHVASGFGPLGNGDGTFQAPRVPGGQRSARHRCGDFNRDGTQDLAVANLGPFPQRATTVAVLLGQGDGTFRSPQTFEAGHALTGIAIGDFNRDGAADLRSAAVTTRRRCCYNGNGTFQSVRATRGQLAEVGGRRLQRRSDAGPSH